MKLEGNIQIGFYFKPVSCIFKSEIYQITMIHFVLECMTFGRVSDLGQFIRESEPEPDVKKSKG